MADKELMAFDAPDLELYHQADLSVDQALTLAIEAENAALNADEQIVNSEGATFNSHSAFACMAIRTECCKAAFPAVIRFRVA